MTFALAAAVISAAAPALHTIETSTQREVSVRVDSIRDYRPIVRIGPILDSRALEDAARSGIPVRVHVRVELWRDGFIDNLASSTGWSTVLLYEPISQQFIVRPPGNAPGLRFASYDSARVAIEVQTAVPLSPPRPGRYYYTANVTVETLSLSDIEELERWLQGELGPAVSGNRSLPGAIGQGAKRLMIRLLNLPARRLEGRTGSFVVRDKGGK